MANKIKLRRLLEVLLYVILLILILEFFTGKGTFIYEGF